MKISTLYEKILPIITLINFIPEDQILANEYIKDFFLSKMSKLGGWMFKLRDATNPSLAQIKEIQITIDGTSYLLVKSIIWCRNQIVHKYFYLTHINPHEEKQLISKILQLKNHLQILTDLISKIPDEDLQDKGVYSKAQGLFRDFTPSDYLAVIINEVFRLNEILQFHHFSIDQLYVASTSQKPNLTVLDSFNKLTQSDEQLFAVLELHYIYLNQALVDYYNAFQKMPDIEPRVRCKSVELKREVGRNTKNIIDEPAQRKKCGTHPDLPSLDITRTIDYFCSFYELRNYCNALLNFLVQEVGIISRYFIYTPSQDRLYPIPQPQLVPQPSLDIVQQIAVQPEQNEGDPPAKRLREEIVITETQEERSSSKSIKPYMGGN